MADFRAIAGVSHTLRQLLVDNMEDAVDVTLAPPDVQPADSTGRRINLFLYRVQENGYLKNQDLPGAGSPGAYGRPPLALDLFYLLTAFGTSEDSQIEAHQILGDAMRVFHDNAVVLGASLDMTLQSEFENVKVYLDPLTLDDITKVWAALTVPYRLSAGYKVTVIQVESRRVRGMAQLVSEPPAGGPRVRALPFTMPVIERLHARRQGDAPGSERSVAYLRIGDTLILEGNNFSGNGLRVFLDGVDATAGITARSQDRIELTVPNDPALAPGPVQVRVQMDILLGEPPVPHRGVQSNAAAFVVVPAIAGVIADLGVDPRTLRIQGTRLLTAGRQNMTLLGTALFAESDYRTASETQIDLDLPGTMGPGAYRIRVRVNGFENLEESILTIP